MRRSAVLPAGAHLAVGVPYTVFEYITAILYKIVVGYAHFYFPYILDSSFEVEKSTLSKLRYSNIFKLGLSLIV